MCIRDRSQGAYTLRLASDGQRLEWISKEADGTRVLNEEPESSFWDRLMLNILSPMVPESLL